MKPATPKTHVSDKAVLQFLAIAAGVTFFFFYIDEGYYNLKWMASGGAWLIFAVYVFALFVPQVLMSEYVFARVPARHRNWLSSVSVIAGICVLIGLVQ